MVKKVEEETNLRVGTRYSYLCLYDQSETPIAAGRRGYDWWPVGFVSSRYHATLGLGYHLCKGRRAEVWRGATGQHDHGGTMQSETVSFPAILQAKMQFQFWMPVSILNASWSATPGSPGYQLSRT